MEETSARYRPWVGKLASGEYAREWNGYAPGLLVSPYQAFFGDELGFEHCTGTFYGVGDVEWWVAAELEGLSPFREAELLNILERNDIYATRIHTTQRGARAAACFGLDANVVHRLAPPDFVALCLRACQAERSKDEELFEFARVFDVDELIDDIPLRPSAAQLMSARKLFAAPNRTFSYWHLDMFGAYTSTSFDATVDPVDAAYSLFQLMDFCGAFADLTDYHLQNLEDHMVDEQKEYGSTQDYADLCWRYDRAKGERVLLNAARDGSKPVAYRLIFDRMARADVGQSGWFADVTALPPADIDHILNKYREDARK